MMTNDATRAKQHLLVQGFTLYTAESAVCTRLVSRELLDDPSSTWAVLFDARSLDWTAQLAEDDLLAEDFGAAAVRSSGSGGVHVLCCTAGARLLVPLTVADVRSARMRIEAAVAANMAPPAERLEAFPDELIEREARRRAKRRG